MQNLYWKINGETRTLVEKPFQNESEMEKYIFANQDLLGDVSIIYRQIKTGQKQGIPDMLGVNQDSRGCRPRSRRGWLARCAPGCCWLTCRFWCGPGQGRLQLIKRIFPKAVMMGYNCPQ